MLTRKCSLNGKCIYQLNRLQPTRQPITGKVEQYKVQYGSRLHNQSTSLIIQMFFSIVLSEFPFLFYVFIVRVLETHVSHVTGQKQLILAANDVWDMLDCSWEKKYNFSTNEIKFFVWICKSYVAWDLHIKTCVSILIVMPLLRCIDKLHASTLLIL